MARSPRIMPQLSAKCGRRLQYYLVHWPRPHVRTLFVSLLFSITCSILCRNSVIRRFITNDQSYPCQLSRLLVSCGRAKHQTITLICNHVAGCLQRSSFEVGSLDPRTVGAISSKSCRGEHSNRYSAEYHQTTNISALLLVSLYVLPVMVDCSIVQIHSNNLRACTVYSGSRKMTGRLGW